jgi:hypothetical protein
MVIAPQNPTATHRNGKAAAPERTPTQESEQRQAPSGREFHFRLPIGYTDSNGTLIRDVVLRKMTGREEAILADRRFQRNGGKLVTELLHSCMVRLGDQPPNGQSTASGMYSADRNFLLLKLRCITFGSELEASYTCPACGEALHTVEDLDELPVRGLPDGESIDDVALELKDGYVDRDGQLHTALRLRLPVGADEEAVAPQVRQNASEGKNALLSRCMRSLGDVPQHRLEAIGPRILADLTLTDRRLIDRALNEAAPGVDLVRTIECSHCGHSFKSTLDLSHFLALE